MDSPPAGGKNLRTQIWGGKDRGMRAEAEAKRTPISNDPAQYESGWSCFITWSVSIQKPAIGKLQAFYYGDQNLMLNKFLHMYRSVC